MSGYRVKLDVFRGPLDLLLYLIKRQEVEIAEVSISEITKQYIEYIEMMRRFDIEPAADFLVMAATLMEIKSEALLPVAPEAEKTDNNPADPRMELVRQLLAYKKFKDASDLLEESADVFAKRIGRPPQELPGGPPSSDGEDIGVGEMEVWDLLKAFVRLMEDTGANRPAVHEVDYDDTPIDVHAEQVRLRLEAEGPLKLQQLLVGKVGRSEIIGLFISLLELAKQRIILIEQTALYGEIRVRLRPAEERGHAAHEAAIAAAEAEAEARAAEAAAAAAANPSAATEDEAADEDDESPAVQSRFLNDDIDPDLLDDEVNSIDVPEIDLDRKDKRRRDD